MLGFGPRKKYPPALLRASGSDMYNVSEYMWIIIPLFCILLLRLDVLRYILENELFVLLFQSSALSLPLTGSLGTSTLWGLYLYHNIMIFLQFFEVVSDYFYPIIQLVIFLIASYFSFHKRVVSRVMVSPGVVYASRVGKYVVLCVHILALKVGLFLFRGPTLVLS